MERFERVRLTNPDKPYFPKLGKDGTKGKLVDYYLSVADHMVALLRDRPVHLQRFPDGIDGEEIYQKRIPQKHPDYLETCTVTFPSGRTADALKITHPSAIVWAAQMGTLTFHPWPVRRPDVDHPDELRIDLDPQPGTSFADAQRVAGVARELLEDLGMRGYPKTSGNRGIHVYVRIEPRWSFGELRHAAIGFGRELERRDDGVTTAWWKEERGERIFVDFNQNNRDRTIAGAWSLRARPGAPVSTPMTWEQIAEVTDPAEHNILTVLDHLAVLHHEAHVEGGRDIRRRVARNGDDIGEVSGCQPAEFATFVDQFGAGDGRRPQGLHRSHPAFH